MAKTSFRLPAGDRQVPRDPRVAGREPEDRPSRHPAHRDADTDDGEPDDDEAHLRIEILPVERKADRLLDGDQCDPRGDDPGGEGQEAPDPLVVGPQTEGAAAGPEARHQADDRRHRGEEGGGRAGPAGDWEDRPDQVRQEAGQGAGPRAGDDADKHRPDRIEVDRQAQGHDDRPDRDVDRDRDRHQRQGGGREVPRADRDDRKQDDAGHQRRQVQDLDRRDAARGLPLGADLEPRQVHGNGASLLSGASRRDLSRREPLLPDACPQYRPPDACSASTGGA
jgi:hypothetical protein